MSNSPLTIQVMPKQKLSDSKKGEEWWEKCVKGGQSLIFQNNQYSRNTRVNKQINYDLYAGRLHPSDMESIMNPMALKDVTFPAKPKNYPITNPYIKSLVGEEIKRRFDYSLKVENEDAISEIETNKKEMFMQKMQEIFLAGLEQPQIAPEDPQAEQKQQQYDQEVAKKLTQLNKYISYEWQDIRELAGERLLNHYINKNECKTLFTKGFEDALICSEEIYHIDIIANEPVVRKCNPLNTYFLVAPDSYKIEDSDLVVEEKYVPIGAVIDDYYEYLKPAQIDYLEERTMYKGTSSYGGMVNYELQNPLFAIPLGGTTAIDITQLNSGYNSYAPFDTQNNVRVCKVKWRSMREIAILTFIDEAGDQQERPVHIDYTVDADAGESIKKIWIGEWWEGTQIANEYIVKTQPCSVQYRSLNNLAQCASGYVGTIYKTNSSVPQSFLDLAKPYQYAYIMYAYRTELAFIKAKGKIANMDLARVPDGWEPDKWIYYAETLGWAVTDSFKEAKKGAAMGKLAGTMNTQADVLNMDLGNYIQQHIEMMQYIENQLDKITGITPQRRGTQVSSNQGLGITQENKIASSTITEWYFQQHDDTKVRVYRALLEAAKYCLRNDNKTIQYISDEVTTEIFKIDGGLINECDYGFVLRDANADAESLQLLRKAAEIALQTGAVDLIQTMDIFSNKSYSSIRRKIEASITKNKEEQAEQAQGEQQHAMELQQQAQQMQTQIHQETMLLEKEKLELAHYKIDADNDTKIRISEMTSLGMDEGPNPEAISKAAELGIKERDLASKQFMNQSKLMNDNIKHSKEMDFKKKELESKQQIEAAKLKQIEVQNKSQELLSNKKHKADLELANKKMQLEKFKAGQAAKKTK